MVEESKKPRKPQVGRHPLQDKLKAVWEAQPVASRKTPRQIAKQVGVDTRSAVNALVASDVDSRFSSMCLIADFLGYEWRLVKKPKKSKK